MRSGGHGGGVWKGVGGSSGFYLRILEKREKEEHVVSYQNKSCFFFSVISQLLESIYTVLIFPPQTSGLCKKVHVSGPIKEGRDCYHCDVISNAAPAFWLTEW